MLDDLESNHIFTVLEDISDLRMCVIQIHVYLEFHLGRIIASEVPIPKHITTENFSFRQLLLLARSLGCVSDQNADTLSKLNGLRNKCAHSLEYVVTASDVERVGRPLGELFSQIQEEYPNNPKGQLMLVVACLSGILSVSSEMAHARRSSKD